MTSRERLVAIARGGAADRKPIVLLSGHHPDADALVVDPPEVSAALAEHPDQAVLALVESPLARAMREEPEILALLHDDPAAGEAVLGRLTAETRQEVTQALAAGADGVFYLLDGAYPAVTSPMQYGGHFLEVDREVLTEIADARFNVLFVAGAEEPYLDFVSDLPAQAFGWDAASGVTVEAVRAMRPGALLASWPDADIAEVAEPADIATVLTPAEANR